MNLRLDNISLSLGATRVLDAVSFSVEDGQFVSLLGKSGAGKSTTLKIIAGIQMQDAGSVLFDGEVVDELPAHKRRTSIVFQDIRLFPHMNVLQNIAFPCKMQGQSKAQREEQARTMLAAVQLEGYEQRMPNELSGGQQQRVALARALAGSPRALLLDEPFSGLDESLRDEMRALVLALHRDLKTTSIMVTHDAQEALLMSDRIVHMHEGRMVQDAADGAGCSSPAREAPITSKMRENRAKRIAIRERDLNVFGCNKRLPGGSHD